MTVVSMIYFQGGLSPVPIKFLTFLGNSSCLCTPQYYWYKYKYVVLTAMCIVHHKFGSCIPEQMTITCLYFWSLFCLHLVTHGNTI